MSEQLTLGLKMNNDKIPELSLEEKKRYKDLLREKLPELKKIEGFPIGEDEDILALSDPPYYTACPNPFIEEFIMKWEWEKHLEHHQEGMKDVEGNAIIESIFDARKCAKCVEKDRNYHREPFTADVSEGKNHPIYNAHSYHTKVPHKAIMRYILHYTEPGDIVFDGFCGTGMTGVAAQLCGDRKAVMELGFEVDNDGIIYERVDDNGKSKKKAISKLGARKAILNDLSPAATFIAYNYNTPVDVEEFEREAKRILAEVEKECGWMYETLHVEPASSRLIEKTGFISVGSNVGPASSRPSDPISKNDPTLGIIGGITDFTIRQGNLPHWQMPGAFYFVTFKTQDGRQLSSESRSIVIESLQHWHDERLRFIAAVVMPDHVHAVLQPLEKSEGAYWDLSDLMHSIKSYTANEINKIEGRVGSPVWQSESYDHIIRDENEYGFVLQYVANNPVQAGLSEKPDGYRWLIFSDAVKEAGWKPAPLGKINYTVWSDVFVCPECAGEIIFWDAAVDKNEGKVRDEFLCQQCGVSLTKLRVGRAWETKYDRYIKDTIKQAKQVPVLINYTAQGKRFEKVPDTFDYELIGKIEEMEIPYWFPTNRIEKGDKTGEPLRIGITHVHHLYTKRNLWVLSGMWSGRENYRSSSLIHFWINAAQRYLSKMSKLGTEYYFHGGGGAVNAGVLGTLYIPSFSAESNVIETLLTRYKKLMKVLRYISDKSYLLETQSLKGVTKSCSFVDYIFTDPPFGGNLMYSELNFLWEAWVKVFTSNKFEAIINRVQAKGVPEYLRLMEQCFKEYYRVLKPGKCITVEFHNSSDAIWKAIQEAMMRSGLMIAHVSILDKKQGSFKQVTTTRAPKQDLVISGYKPVDTDIKPESLKEISGEGVVWNFVTYHLKQLPVFLGDKGAGELVVERTPRFLFDRMVAYFVQRGFAVPMSSGEFQAKVLEKYPERDGMIFLPEEVPEYERKKITLKEFVQMKLFVEDENSAIEWLRQQLKKKPQSYQDLVPDYMRELQHLDKFEKMPELIEILDQNFLQYTAAEFEKKAPVPRQIASYLRSNYHTYRGLEDTDPELQKMAKGRWYVPDPNESKDLEKIREKTLLREFSTYIEQIRSNKKKLKQFRLEAIRCGFKHAWQEKNYKTIVEVGNHLPDQIIQEDQTLLMYFDNASIRVEE